MSMALGVLGQTVC